MELIIANLLSPSEPHGYVAHSANAAGLWAAKVETLNKTFTASCISRKEAVKWVHKTIRFLEGT